MNTSARMIVQAPAVALAAMLFGAPVLAQKDDLPAQTEEGLVRQESKRLDVVYWRPGATLAGYKRIGLIDCEVQFVKDWAEDQNRSRPGVNRVTAEDMDRIRMGLSEEFRKVFTKELAEEGGYQIVDVVGDDVLILRPAIVNLDVNAPDIDTASRSRSYVSSAGQMTLYMDLYDAATRSLIGRVIDHRDASEGAYYQMANSVTNKAEADRIIRAWAKTLRDALDEQWSGNPRKTD
jgi:Protein of unknown function (DUF3313)